MFRLLTLSLAAALVSLSSPAHAQVRTAFPAERGLSIADFPRLVPVGEGVYAYEALRKPGFTTVSMIVVGSDGVLIADGQESDDATKSEEHTSELQSLMRNSYAVFCLKKQKK